MAIEVINEEERMIHADKIREAPEAEAELEAIEGSAYITPDINEIEVEEDNA